MEYVQFTRVYGFHGCHGLPWHDMANLVANAMDLHGYFRGYTCGNVHGTRWSIRFPWNSVEVRGENEYAVFGGIWCPCFVRGVGDHHCAIRFRLERMVDAT